MPMAFNMVFTGSRMLSIIEKSAKLLRTQRCLECGLLVVYGFKDEEGCPYVGHPGVYEVNRGWSCCDAIKKKTPGCGVVRREHSVLDFGSSWDAADESLILEGPLSD